MKACPTPIFALLLLCTGAGAALATTPDGYPPALETVCDMETGAAYGLCNAYCEAMDCETDNPAASAAACSRVGDKFQQLTGRGLPCEVTCPCADPAVSNAFVEVLAGNVPISSCLTEPTNFILDGTEIYSPAFGDDWVFAVELFPGFQICGASAEEFALPISPEQFQVCNELLEQAAASQGVPCVPGTP